MAGKNKPVNNLSVTNNNLRKTLSPSDFVPSLDTVIAKNLQDKNKITYDIFKDLASKNINNRISDVKDVYGMAKSGLQSGIDNRIDVLKNVYNLYKTGYGNLYDWATGNDKEPLGDFNNTNKLNAQTPPQEPKSKEELEYDATLNKMNNLLNTRLNAINVDYKPNKNYEVVTQEQVDAIMNKQSEESGLSKWGRALQRIGAGFASMSSNNQERAKMLIAAANEADDARRAEVKAFYEKQINDVKMLREQANEKNRVTDNQNDMLWREKQVEAQNADRKLSAEKENLNNELSLRRLALQENRNKQEEESFLKSIGIEPKDSFTNRQIISTYKELMTNPKKALELDLDVSGISGLPDPQQVKSYIAKIWGGVNAKSLSQPEGNTATAGTTKKTPSAAQLDAYKRAKTAPKLPNNSAIISAFETQFGAR
jgi:hypothetical protein